MQLLKKINFVVLIINLILAIIMGVTYFLSPGMAAIVGVIFSIAGFFTIVLLIWLYNVDLQNIDLITTVQKVQLIIIAIFSVVLIALSLDWIDELPEAIENARTYQANKPQLNRFQNRAAPIENGVWEYKNWDDRMFTVPCKNGKIDGRVIIDEAGGFVTNEFYNKGKLDSTITYTDYAIFEKEYYDEKTKMRVRYEYSANYQELINSDTTVTLLKK